MVCVPSVPFVFPILCIQGCLKLFYYVKIQLLPLGVLFTHSPQKSCCLRVTKFRKYAVFYKFALYCCWMHKSICEAQAEAKCFLHYRNRRLLLFYGVWKGSGKTFPPPTADAMLRISSPFVLQSFPHYWTNYGVSL